MRERTGDDGEVGSALGMGDVGGEVARVGEARILGARAYLYQTRPAGEGAMASTTMRIKVQLTPSEPWNALITDMAKRTSRHKGRADNPPANLRRENEWWNCHI